MHPTQSVDWDRRVWGSQGTGLRDRTKGPPVKEEGCKDSWMRGCLELHEWWSLELEKAVGLEMAREEVSSHGKSSPGSGEAED
jgi:hypothetical protein